MARRLTAEELEAAWEDVRRWMPPEDFELLESGALDHMTDDPPIPIGVRLPDGRIIRGKTDAETLELLRAEGVEIAVPAIPDRPAPAPEASVPKATRKRRVGAKT